VKSPIASARIAPPLLLCLFALLLAGCDGGSATSTPAPGNGGASGVGGNSGLTTEALLAIHPCGWVDPTKMLRYGVAFVPYVDVFGAFPKGTQIVYDVVDVKTGEVLFHGSTPTYGFDTTVATLPVASPLRPGTYRILVYSNNGTGACANAPLGLGQNFTVQ
jgi:hypothetical protein